MNRKERRKWAKLNRGKLQVFPNTNQERFQKEIKTDLSSTTGVYKYLFQESPHKDFWLDYHKHCRVFVEEHDFLGIWIKSPFLVTSFDERPELEEMFVKGAKSRWDNFKETQNLWMVERAFRQTYLLSYLKENAKTLTKEKINELIIDLWEDTESPGNSKKTWNEIFTFLTPSLLDRSELPESEFKIYRGGELNGRSWTLSKEKGEWFAERFNELYEDYLFYEKTITADDVLFYTNGRDEQEVVLKESSLFSLMDECA